MVATARLAPPASVSESRTIVLPEELARRLEARLRGSAFSDLDDFVAFVLARLLEAPAGEVPLSEADEARLRERLRSLGYID